MSIEAMKQLVHEMEYVLDCINKNKMPFDGDDFHEALRLGRQAIALEESLVAEAEKQEPVAWRVSYPNDPELGFWFAEGIGGEGCLNEPLYTSPPQRQPLTDEQADKLVNENRVEGYPQGRAIVRATEAAHGIKEKNT